MNAQQARELTEQKINHVIIDAIKDSAKNGEHEVCLEYLIDGEDPLQVTKEDKKWLIIHGYQVFEKNEYCYWIADVRPHIYVSWEIKD